MNCKPGKTIIKSTAALNNSVFEEVQIPHY